MPPDIHPFMRWAVRFTRASVAIESTNDGHFWVDAGGSLRVAGV